MQLILDDYGVCLEKSEHMFSIKLGEQSRQISPVKVTAIHVYKTAMISTAALLLAAEKAIPVLIYDSYHKPAVRVWNSNFSSTGMIRVNQPLFCNSPAGMYWCKKIVLAKFEGMLANIAQIKNRWKLVLAESEQVQKQLEAAVKQISALPDEASGIPSVNGIEGATTAAYWKLLQALLSEEIFTKREQQGSTDKFNPCINYLYGVLYGKVEGALLAYGLDPMVGILHAEGYSKKSLVYDCIEPFRHWAEILLVQLFKSKTLSSTHFEYNATGVSLTKAARKLLVTEFIKLLNEKTLMNQRRITRNDQIYFLCSQLAQAVKNYTPEY
jgi:CRISPR-associated protein Cas1